MNNEENIQLMNCYTNGDTSAKESVITVKRYTDMLNSGEISKDEYSELMNDIIKINEINTSIDNMQNMEKLNIVINVLINLATTKI